MVLALEIIGVVTRHLLATRAMVLGAMGAEDSIGEEADCVPKQLREGEGALRQSRRLGA